MAAGLRPVVRKMTQAARAALSHLERTASEPRQNTLHRVKLTRIDQVNPKIRLLRLSSTDPNAHIKFRPGQWLDIHIPGVRRVGGFTITSTPKDAEPKSIGERDNEDGYLELAIQDSPENEPAAWLWQPREGILGKELEVRVGGSFMWPPPGGAEGVRRVVLIAGGVGINPLMSILSHLYQNPGELPRYVKVLYTTRSVISGLHNILFYPRISQLLSADPSVDRTLDMYVTGEVGKVDIEKMAGDEAVRVYQRRISHEDMEQALGPVQDREEAAVYVCGPAKLTDEFVEALGRMEGMNPDRVLFERWW